MNATVRERLIRANQKFLLAIVSYDEESHDNFSQEWSQLAHDIENIKATGRLDDDTALLLFKVSRAIESTTLCMLECMAISQESLTRSIGDVIQDIPFDDPSTASLHSQAIAPHHLLFSDPPSSKTPKILGQKTLLDSYAYCWLMQNIHDPYPDSVQTRIISDASGASVAQVEHWFQEVRDSIGWSKLSHKFFASSVTATVAAARRIFLEYDKDVSFEIVFAFKAAKAYAETLFLDPSHVQGKDVDTRHVQTVQTTPAFRAPQEPLSNLSDSDESEEDTTPPPSIAGCKRPLSEDVLISQVTDLVRPQKRRRCVFKFCFSRSLKLKPVVRTWSISLPRASEPKCPIPLPSVLTSEQTIPYISVAPVSSFPFSHPSSQTSPEYSSEPSPSISQKRGCVEDTLEGAEGSIPTHVPVNGIRKRRLSQCVSLAPSKRQCRPFIPSKQYSDTNPLFDGCGDLSPSQDRSTGPNEFLQPMLRDPVDSDNPVSLGVFDWNSISDPLTETTSSMCMWSTLPLSNPSSSARLLYYRATGSGLCSSLGSRISAPRTSRSCA